jgi:hypothetical protein
MTDMNDKITIHCDELNRCNQRGGRMLSIFDLLAAKTLDLDLAAYLMARISTGSSFMVGSVPGGAGKTTVMCALLNFVPVDVPLIAATPEAVYEAANTKVSPSRACYVCHEIGSGYYFAYLWADELRAYCGLSDQGHILATNLHADNLEQAKDQVCNTNSVPGEHFNKFELLIFLGIESHYIRAKRWIEEVYSSDSSSGHELIFRANDKNLDENAKHYLADPEYVNTCRDFLTKIPPDVCTIEDTRRHVVEFLNRIK